MRHCFYYLLLSFSFCSLLFSARAMGQESELQPAAPSASVSLSGWVPVLYGRFVVRGEVPATIIPLARVLYACGRLHAASAAPPTLHFEGYGVDVGLRPRPEGAFGQCVGNAFHSFALRFPELIRQFRSVHWDAPGTTASERRERRERRPGWSLSELYDPTPDEPEEPPDFGRGVLGGMTVVWHCQTQNSSACRRLLADERRMLRAAQQCAGQTSARCRELDRYRPPRCPLHRARVVDMRGDMGHIRDWARRRFEQELCECGYRISAGRVTLRVEIREDEMAVVEATPSGFGRGCFLRTWRDDAILGPAREVEVDLAFEPLP